MKDGLDEQIVRVLAGQGSRDDVLHLERWRRASPDNDRYYLQFRALWELTDAHPSARPQGDIPTADELLRTPLRWPSRPPRTRPARLEGGHPAYRFKLAAAAAVILLSIGLGHALQSVSTAGDTEFRTGPNELSSVVLDDGTMVRLAPSSRIGVAFESGRRVVTLRGRAFFAVTHDADRPFDVHTDDGVVRVLGTRFDLHSQPGRDGTRLLVLDGRVSLSTRSGTTDLEAGELAITSSSSTPSIRRVQDPERLLDWMGAWVAFEGTPLHRVARELEVRLGVPIEITDPAVGERTVVGWFAQEEPAEMIELVCRVADVTCEWIDDRVVISGRAR